MGWQTLLRRLFQAMLFCLMKPLYIQRDFILKTVYYLLEPFNKHYVFSLFFVGVLVSSSHQLNQGTILRTFAKTTIGRDRT